MLQPPLSHQKKGQNSENTDKTSFYHKWKDDFFFHYQYCRKKVKWKKTEKNLANPQVCIKCPYEGENLTWFSWFLSIIGILLTFDLFPVSLSWGLILSVSEKKLQPRWTLFYVVFSCWWSMLVWERQLFVFHSNEDYTRGQDTCNTIRAVLMGNIQGDIIILNKIQAQNFQVPWFFWYWLYLTLS